MYFIRRCWFLKWPEEGLLVGVGCVLLVNSEIYYVPVDDGWEVVLVCNVLHYVPVLHSVPITQPPSPPLFRTFNRATFSSCDGEGPSLNYLKVPPRWYRIKAPMRFELMSSCLSDRRFNKLCHGASQWGDIFILWWREPKFILFKGSTEMVQYKGTDKIRTHELLFIRQAL